MGFQFGSVRQQEKPRQNLQKFDSLLKEHWQPGSKYYLFVVDNVISKTHLDILAKDIEKHYITSYNIVSAISVKDPTNDSTDSLLSYESNWRQYLTFNDTPAHCIIAFGSVIRILNRSGDVTYYDFFDDKFNDPRYYCGSEFVDGPNKWIYPVAPVKELYPVHINNDPTNMLTRFFREKLERIQRDDMSTDSLDVRPYQIHYIDTKEETSKSLQLLMNAELLALDTETDGLDFLVNKLGTVQLSVDGENSYVFDWENVDKRIFKKVLTTATRITLANAKFDVKFIWKNGVTGWYPTDDTVLLSHAINSNRSKGLKPGAIFYCGKFTGYDDELDKARKQLKVDNFLQIPKQILIKYAGLDAIVTWRVQKALDKHVAWVDKMYPNEKLKEWTIERWYREVMIPNANTVTDVEFEGIYFDKDQFAISEKIIVEKIASLKDELSKLWNVPTTFKFESTKELGLLFKRMGWPEIDTAKDGGYKTSDTVLTEYELLEKDAKLKAKGINICGIKTLKDLRSYNVALKTFINGWREWLRRHPDGSWRIHPSCNTFGTESYRHAMRDPNFQQIPSGSTIAPHIKKLFTVPDKNDWLLVNADFRSLQLILAFCDCGINKNGVDPIAYKIYGQGGTQDAHSMTTHSVFCEPVHLEIIEIEDDDGNKIIFGEEQKIKILRKGLIDDNEELVIKGAEFQADDVFVEYVL